jgi:hypothetical protein
MTMQAGADCLCDVDRGEFPAGSPFYGQLTTPLLRSLGKCSIEKQMLDTNSRIDEYLPIKIIFAQNSFAKIAFTCMRAWA